MRPILTALSVALLAVPAFANEDRVPGGSTTGMDVHEPTGGRDVTGARAPAASRAMGGAGTAAEIGEDWVAPVPADTAAPRGPTGSATDGPTGSSSSGTGR